MSAKLFVTRNFPPAVQARAAAEFDATLNPADAPIDTDALIERSKGYDAILLAGGNKLDAATVERLDSSIKVVGTFSVGFDHVDTQALKARGIALVNTPDVLSVATAEISMLLILMAARRAGEAERMVRAGQWHGWTPTQLVGREVTGLRLGILGMGRIGQELAAMARGFRMEVHYRNRRRLDPSEEAGAIFHDKDDSFLAVSDVLSLNAPATPETEKWLNAARIEKLPENPIVVNAARGALVDDAALIAALRSGRVLAAGLDVFNGEPQLDPEYLTLENAVLLPHVGSATTKARDAMGFIALDGIAAVLKGETPKNRVV